MKNNYQYDCSSCPKKCDGVSKKKYLFDNDTAFSEYYEQQLIKGIIKQGYFATKTTKAQYPDIEVYDQQDGKLLCYIEVKAQQRTFMRVQNLLPYSDLLPSETLALNLSDLEHYISQSKIVDVPIYVVWFLASRPCIVDDKKVVCFYNHISKLEQILTRYGNKRRFKRASGDGDIVNGQHKGVTVNYHFSIAELMPFYLSEILR